MIDFENYERLTNQKWSDKIDLKQEYGYSHIYKRLYELENNIEKGLLVSRYSISQDLKYGWWCVCEVDEQSWIKAQCKTKGEAKRKLEELENKKRKEEIASEQQ